ncbi:hypothetical protein HNY73_007605 [Argiope bruennichi]|uniref:Uncharacterized protein n=1 Tax=Argiope bruennichi TaxID=94029 RepID=A0A8T0FLK2_ARGBR|nr:hypothetical protein HNY73_007605 [Argiope bruennichi]
MRKNVLNFTILKGNEFVDVVVTHPPGEGKPRPGPGGPVASVPHKSAESPVQPAAAYKKRQDKKKKVNRNSRLGARKSTHLNLIGEVSEVKWLRCPKS